MADRHKLLLQSPHLQQETSAIRFSELSSQSYALSIVALEGQYAVVASSPANTIDIFDKATLQGIETLSGHELATTSIKVAKKLCGSSKLTLVSSGKDGSIKAWDDRTNTHSIKMTNLGKPQSFLCCDVSPDGSIVAAGTDLRGEDASILYWDPRQPAVPLRSHNATHSDDITTISFASTKDRAGGFNVLLSGSSDGLVCTSNADEDDEDEATIQVGNWGCSISQAGWIHPRATPGPAEAEAKVWAASDMETLSTWTSDLSQLVSLDIRTPALHQQTTTWETDYLITCHSSSTSNPRLAVFAGSNNGNAALLSNMNISTPDAPWCLHKIWKNGHDGIVRSLFWDEPNNVIVTGGEDSRLRAWKYTPIVEAVEAEPEVVDEDDEMDLDVSQVASPKNRRHDSDDEAPVTRKRSRRSTAGSMDP